MSFVVELERIVGGKLTFKVRKKVPVNVDATPLGEPFNMRFEDRPYGTGNRFGGKPEERYGNFGEQMDFELVKRGLTVETANTYLAFEEPREINKAHTVYRKDLPPIERPRIVEQRMQFYSVSSEIARKQREFIANFIFTWAGK